VFIYQWLKKILKKCKRFIYTNAKLQNQKDEKSLEKDLKKYRLKNAGIEIFLLFFLCCISYMQHTRCIFVQIHAFYTIR